MCTFEPQGEGETSHARAVILKKVISNALPPRQLFVIKDARVSSVCAAERDAARVVKVRAHERHQRVQPTAPPCLVLIPVNHNGGQRPAINCRAEVNKAVHMSASYTRARIQ